MKIDRNRLLLVVSALAFMATASVQATEAPSAQKTFDTPRQAADALIAAAKADDVPAMLAIFGPEGKDIVSSGDKVSDKQDLSKFVEKANVKTEISYDLGDPKRAILVVGSDDWPLPVPIVQRNGKWRFDAKEGRLEILARRIGSNELDAIALLRGYVEAQMDYAMEAHDPSGIRQYAQKWISTPGKHDGLSWYDSNGKPAGPIGDQIAKLLAAGYTEKADPVNGYYFRTLTAQGPNAPLGARNYIVNGMMIGGFAAIAWPAQYGVTGVQTFQVNHDGIVSQKDLGPETSTLAPAIKAYNPDKTWIITRDAE
jgi:hypothetical protein